MTVILDGYTTTSTLDSTTTLQLGTTLILICRTGGIPHGTDLTYTWTCPNGPCDVGQGRNTNRKTYQDRLLVNILSTSDAGTYTCQVGLSTTSQVLGTDQFVLGVEGRGVHMYCTDIQHHTVLVQYIESRICTTNHIMRVQLGYLQNITLYSEWLYCVHRNIHNI